MAQAKVVEDLLAFFKALSDPTSSCAPRSGAPVGGDTCQLG